MYPLSEEETVDFLQLCYVPDGLVHLEFWYIISFQSKLVCFEILKMEKHFDFALKRGKEVKGEEGSKRRRRGRGFPELLWRRKWVEWERRTNKKQSGWWFGQYVL